MSHLQRTMGVLEVFRYDQNGHLLTGLTPALAKFTVNTGIVAIDCEMVGVGSQMTTALARVSIVNVYGYCLYDKFVKPNKVVTDFRTGVSGIRPQDLQNATPHNIVVKEVTDLLRGQILVGHSLKHDFAALGYTHPRNLTRDTSLYYKEVLGDPRTPGLKLLMKDQFDVNIQDGAHSSITDAQAAMALYIWRQEAWDSSKQFKMGHVGTDPFVYFDYDRIGRPIVGGKTKKGLSPALSVDFKLVKLGPKSRAVGWVSVVNDGIGQEDLETATPHDVVVKEVNALLKGHVVVGRNLEELSMLELSIPQKDQRDIAKYLSPKLGHLRFYPGLCVLAEQVFHININYEGGRSSVKDAQILMAFYQRYRQQWKMDLGSKKVKECMKKNKKMGGKKSK